MSDLYDILRPWPVVSALTSFMGLGDILNLSRANSECRAILHGFSSPATSAGDNNDPVRHDIYIGEHQTPYWKALKNKGQKLCSEPKHRIGSAPKLCRFCSLPVCEACIVKESFLHPAPTYKTRTRRFCIDCWISGTPHVGHHFTSSPPRSTPYDYTHDAHDCCTCTAFDGWICSTCREVQCKNALKEAETCIGEGCSQPPGKDSERRRVCLWCDLPLFAPSMKQYRDAYGKRKAVLLTEEVISRPTYEEVA